ncbi:hypothetical protein [Photobacterium leiognathi]|uniref:hypothetical protein n=1 Tax=Photobacterium leiognathi TaxID=553611 RepID=UPI0027385AC5|nr:hypothetical protein [Photobacterium leiognathi]
MMLNWISDILKTGKVKNKSLFEKIDSELIRKKESKDLELKSLESNLILFAKYLNEEFGTKNHRYNSRYVIEREELYITDNQTRPIYISYSKNNLVKYLLRGVFIFDINYSFSTKLIQHSVTLNKVDDKYVYRLLNSKYEFNYMYEFVFILKDKIKNDTGM